MWIHSKKAELGRGWISVRYFMSPVQNSQTRDGGWLRTCAHSLGIRQPLVPCALRKRGGCLTWVGTCGRECTAPSGRL